MGRKTCMRTVFSIAALYDGLLGGSFLVAGERLFAAYKVAPPNHWGYIQFPAALLLVFALMFAAIARRPWQNRNLIPYGMLLKVSYCSVIGWHWWHANIPGMWVPFAVIDFVFLILFIAAWFATAHSNDACAPASPPTA
ncbi:MAG TPA: hypothetical protein PLD40_01505 [Kiritimatiellia bacterium]|jgi:hypothetical protein|nr:MAG: hypothetical protein BWX54_00257 [Verrucomicrobia bacterium ADurb.Bin018]HOD99995.1 hypothetical protein [Kiritimatiellia bacterium]HOE36877.1 hypothetical protein [Kiritimatiellia bacterium]HOR74935.1 hypothetical protein [Kiritimatiellia bacterium]HOU58807.1 hypothetical protein [Kiritimatiellia bacterium]